MWVGLADDNTTNSGDGDDENDNDNDVSICKFIGKVNSSYIDDDSHQINSTRLTINNIHMLLPILLL